MRAVCYSGTRNLYADMVGAVKSLLTHTKVDRVILLIEDDTFPYWMPSCVEFVNVSDQASFDPSGPNYYQRWTYMTLMKVALFKMFPELDEILMLDVDTIVEMDISDLWKIDLSEYYVAGVREPYKTKRDGRLYINAGVMLINLAKMWDGMGDRLIEVLNTRHFDYLEQDAINELCEGKIKQLPPAYNSSTCTDYDMSPRITHYAAIRDWQTLPLPTYYRDTPWPPEVL